MFVSCLMLATPPHSLSSKRPRVLVPSPPAPPPITRQRMRDTKQEMQTRGNVNHKMTRKLPAGMHAPSPPPPHAY